MSKQDDSVRRWREIVRRQAGSGLSVAAFCRRSRIPQATFYAWRRRLREMGASSDAGRSTSTFAEVRVTPDPASDAGALELHLRCGRRVAVRPGFDPQTLLDLVATLEAGE